ncbi:hypothetical protein N9J68_00425 [Gammaproteobacteria bacterium]|nr:hypothetical protein [Gammaproteobacteria bacterium]MDA7786332.1 hypothetical protein [Gammaproteobacteria bacterium]MDA7802296.1 hypothetical protein [Gammaproteobacteria bacterium]MDA7818607.1 hypothetical protein [Gammaproteobacteria bacterium]MDA7856325.1 hypothetical protein [Gammaproteobacteria bacterium]|tara:strand:+ start:15871 stop:16065 length:195 start_codon:yes stop_codon:yes gene_type:complete
MENDNNSLSLLEKRLDDLLNRFLEQQGIIDSYIIKERDWKKSKLLKNKEIKALQDEIKKVKTDG